ncbi:Valyl-tRNA synthetase [Myotis brandtii]|uniref:valine--tRNA ligase n=1 Tax=Myotis brandtii TaxID=109478 RepID=S7PWV9_MYOBR|nr:Valyl-tRNA synthetase [Myotis brandtii]
MNPQLSTAVTEAFVRLHEEGVIYSSTHLVNWSCTLNTAISDIEVDKELRSQTLHSVPGYKEKVEFGVLISFACKVQGSERDNFDGDNSGKCGCSCAPQRSQILVPEGEEHDPPPSPPPPFLSHIFDDFRSPLHMTRKTTRLGRGTVWRPLASWTPDGPWSMCLAFLGLPRFEAWKAVLVALKEWVLLGGIKDNPMVVPLCNQS